MWCNRQASHCDLSGGSFFSSGFASVFRLQDLTKSFNNVRNSFITNWYVPLDVQFEGEEQVRLRLIFRDTMLLVPGHSKSLRSVGEFVGSPKIVLDADLAKEREIKKNMDVLRSKNWPLFRNYAINDATLCVKFAQKIIELHKATTGKHTIPATLTSIGVSLLLKSWKRSGHSHLELLGREEIAQTQWNARNKRYYNKKEGSVYP